MEANNKVTNLIDLPVLEEDSDDLSLRDLQVTINSPTTSEDAISVAPPDVFEFFSVNDPFPVADEIIFCGKLIKFDESETIQDDKDCLKILSSRTSDQPSYLFDESDQFSRGNRSENVQCRSVNSVHKVNITSLTSMSSKARRRMFMFGPVKFKPEMELSAIRERQNRRTPGLMFPAIGIETAVDEGNGEMKLSVGVKSRHLTDILAKSLCYR